MTTRRPLQLTPRGIIASLFVFAVAATCVRLGFWQLDRREQRAARNAALEERMAAEPIPLEDSPRDTTGLLYRRVLVRGHLDHDRSIILPGHSYRGAPGVHVLTPLLLPSGRAVLVNRGWLPAADAATVDLSQFRPQSAIDGVALVLPFPGSEPGARIERSALGGAGRASGDFQKVWFAMDPDALRRQFPYELGGIHVQLLPGDSAGGLPVRLAAPELDPGPHLGYAIQWFSFATIALVGWLVLFMKNSVAPSRPRPL